MEIIVELLFELFGQLILTFLAEVIGSLFGSLFSNLKEGVAGRLRAPTKPEADSPDANGAAPERSFSPAAKLAFYLCLSGLFGWVSLHLFPVSLARHMDTKIAMLIGVPLVCGLLMAVIGEFKRKRGRVAQTLESFGYGLAFALPMALIRFLWTR